MKTQLCRLAKIGVLAMIGLSCATFAEATSFTIAGLFDNGAKISGTVTFGTTCDWFVDSSCASPTDSLITTAPTALSWPGLGNDPLLAIAGSAGSARMFGFEDETNVVCSPGCSGTILVLLFSGNSLNYTGGSLCSTSAPCAAAGGPSVLLADPSGVHIGSLVSGTLTPVDASVPAPEPATLVLTGLGLVGLGTRYRRRR